MTYASRMTLSFALTAIMTVAVLVVVLAVVWEGQFQRYTRANMERLAENTADQIAESYDSSGGWTDEVLSRAETASSSSSDVGIQVVDAAGEVVYDDTWAASSEKDETAGKGASLAPTATDSTVSASITSSSGEVVGTVRIWAFGSDALLTKSDAAFRTNSYGAIAAAAGIAVILACVIGVFVSRSLSRPIQRITATASQIRNGDLTARTGLKGSDEMGQLGETFDDMANSLEKDLKLEHRLTSDVAHELRTPLMAMLATVEAMQDGVLPTDEEHLETVASEVRRLSRLVDAMLQLSRLENGTTAFEPVETDVVSLVRGIVSAQEQLFADQGLKLRFADETPHKEARADVDRDMLRQAVINLMSNAMRYTPEDGWIVVTVSIDKTDVLVSVSDTGIGIAKEDLSRVFSRFWRSDASRERVSGGLGVGLSVTKEIIDRHHGFISVESELDKGTTFTLHLPREHRTMATQSSSTMEG
ncbi:MAG: HAMP domain-containing histidine kinase [Atopobiaceae bacterium]|jgi:signal transduction histidine kinase|nr:HAMP domain-containing histidine kinase [Atopobiaceae bacterium]MCI2173683.1 HAMP domain-containing histidine kinase [Atopobiaceae bacterium]MCI2207675.1 HAMP domain-containing histidine kinase [Atopobiaceae bacterium]